MAVNIPEEVQKKKKRAVLWNLMTFFMIVGTGCLVYYFVIIFRDPRSPFNPFPPEPSPTVYITETPTITPIQQPATWTSTATIKPVATRTRAYTWTALGQYATYTFTQTASITLTPSITSTSMPVSADITYHPSTEIYPGKGCDWSGITGSIFDLDGNPLTFYTVQLGGALDEMTISQMKLSGSAPEIADSGFLFELGNHPVASTQTLWIQVIDNTLKALTEKIHFDTYDDCERNWVEITFTKTR